MSAHEYIGSFFEELRRVLSVIKKNPLSSSKTGFLGPRAPL
jgi:hypothetical protein